LRLSLLLLAGALVAVLLVSLVSKLRAPPPPVDKTTEKLVILNRAVDVAQRRLPWEGNHVSSLKEILDVNAAYSGAPVADVTVILNHFKRDSLHLILAALTSGTVKPQEVWVCIFASPLEAHFRAVVEQFRLSGALGGRIHIIRSDYNFKFYGRFQLALAAATKYVWLMDDDVIPGRRYLELLMHSVSSPQTRGALGSVGWLMPSPPQEYAAYIATKKLKFRLRPNVLETYRQSLKFRLPLSWKFNYRRQDRYGGLYFPDEKYRIPSPVVLPVDLLCSQWFLETRWVALLFREKWLTFETAEDYMLAYSLRRYANVQSLVLPSHADYPEFSGIVGAETVIDPFASTRKDFLAQFSSSPSTLQQPLHTQFRSTTGDMVTVRQRLWQGLVSKGGQYFWLSSGAGGPQSSTSSLILVVTTLSQAPTLGKFCRAFMHSPDTKVAVLAILEEEPWPSGLGVQLMKDQSPLPSLECRQMAAQLGLQGGVNAIGFCRADMWGVYFSVLGRDYPAGAASYQLRAAMDVQRTLAEVVKTISPAIIVHGVSSVGVDEIVATTLSSAGSASSTLASLSLASIVNAVVAASPVDVGVLAIPIHRPAEEVASSGASVTLSSGDPDFKVQAYYDLAARAAAELPEGALASWQVPQITFLIAALPEDFSGQLQDTIGALRDCFFLTARPHLRVVLPHQSTVLGSYVSSLSDLWPDAPVSISYVSVPEESAAQHPATVMTLAGHHVQSRDDFVIPLVAGATPPPLLLFWLKGILLRFAYSLGAQCNAQEGYSPGPTRTDISGASVSLSVFTSSGTWHLIGAKAWKRLRNRCLGRVQDCDLRDLDLGKRADLRQYCSLEDRNVASKHSDWVPFTVWHAP
jgi:hypothetical protein